MKESTTYKRSAIMIILALLTACVIIFVQIAPTISRYVTAFNVGDVDVSISRRKYKVTLEVGEYGSLPENFENPFYVTWGDPYPELPYPSDPYAEIAFGGWYLTPDGDDRGRKMTGFDFGEPGDKVLYALWVSENYDVIFNANGGTGTMATESYIFSKLTDVKSLPLNTFTRPGYVFTSWNTEPDGSGRTYLDGGQALQIIKDRSGSVTLYAQWAVGDAVVNFEGPLNDPSQKVRVVNYNEPYGTLPEVPEHNYSAGEEFDFQGWRNFDAEMVLAEDLVSPSIGLKQTLYANYSNVVETDNLDRFISIANKDNNGDTKADSYVITFEKGQGYERFNIPFHNLKEGLGYRLTFKLGFSNEVTTIDDPNAVFGSYMSDHMILSTTDVIDINSTPGIGGGEILAKYGDTIQSAYTNDQSNAFAFVPTAPTMYWVWDLGLLADTLGVQRIEIYDISMDVLVGVPDIEFENYVFTYGGANPAPSLTERSIGDYDIHYTFTAGEHDEQLSIPISNLSVGHTYRIYFSEINPGIVTTNTSYDYSCAMLDRDRSGLDGIKWWHQFSEGDYVGEKWVSEKDTSKPMQSGSITFTATKPTMYWTWLMGAIDTTSDKGPREMMINVTKFSHVLYTGEREFFRGGDVEFEFDPIHSVLAADFPVTTINSNTSRTDPLRYFTSFEPQYPIKVYVDSGYSLTDGIVVWHDGQNNSVSRSSMTTGTDALGSYYRFVLTPTIAKYDESGGKISVKAEAFADITADINLTNSTLVTPILTAETLKDQKFAYEHRYIIECRANAGYTLADTVVVWYNGVPYSYNVADMSMRPNPNPEYGGDYYSFSISNDGSGDLHVPYLAGGKIAIEVKSNAPVMMMMRRPVLTHQHCDNIACTLEECGHELGDLLTYDCLCDHEHTDMYACDCPPYHLHCDSFECTLEECGHELGGLVPEDCDCGHEHTDMYDCDCPPDHYHCDSTECTAEECGHALGDVLPDGCDCGHEHSDTYECDCPEPELPEFHLHCDNFECTVENCGHELGGLVTQYHHCGHEHTDMYDCDCEDQTEEETPPAEEPTTHSHCDNAECTAELCGHAYGDVLAEDCDCGHEHTDGYVCDCPAEEEPPAEETTHIHCDCTECTVETCGHAYGEILPEECDCGHDHADTYVCDCPADDTTEGDTTEGDDPIEGDDTTTEDGTQDPALPPEEDNDDPALPPEDGGDGGNGSNTGGSEEDSEEGEGTGDSGGSTDEGGDTTEGENTTPEGGETTEGEITTPEGGEATEGENTTPEGGEATEGENTTFEGGEATEGENITPEGGETTEGEITTPEGGEATEGENITPEGGETTEGETTTPEGGEATEGENITPEGGEAVTGEATIPESSDATESGSTVETGESTNTSGGAEGDGSASAEGTASDVGGESPAGESADSSEPSGETI